MAGRASALGELPAEPLASEMDFAKCHDDAAAAVAVAGAGSGNSNSNSNRSSGNSNRRAKRE